jgi:hypothetical protein
LQIAVELEVSGRVGLFEVPEVESSEATRQHTHGQEEAGPAGDPAVVVRGDSAAGYDAM